MSNPTHPALGRFFINQNDIKDLSLLKAGPTVYTNLSPVSDPYQTYPIQYEGTTPDEFKAILWDLHWDYQKEYYCQNINGPTGPSDPPTDLQKVYVKITRRLYPYIAFATYTHRDVGSTLDYGYPPGTHQGEALPPGHATVALPGGGPPYSFAVWTASANSSGGGPFDDHGPNIIGTVYFIRDDVGPNTFSAWTWTASGQGDVVWETPGTGYIDFGLAHVNTISDVVQASTERRVAGIIFPNFRSPTDQRVLSEEDDDPPVIFYEVTPPIGVDEIGADGDYWVDTSTYPVNNYGPKASDAWPSLPIGGDIPTEVFKAAERYKHKVAQACSAMNYYTSVATPNRKVWFFDPGQGQIYGVWNPVLPPVDPPGSLAVLDIRDGDYRPPEPMGTINNPGPDGELSPLPSASMAVYLPSDSHFPIGGELYDLIGFTFKRLNPVSIVGDSGTGASGYWYFDLDPSHTGNEPEVLATGSQNWTDSLGNMRTAVFKRVAYRYDYYVEVSAKPIA